MYYDGLVNGEHMKKTTEILPEILIAKSLSQLDQDIFNQTSNFVRLIKAAVVKGSLKKYIYSSGQKSPDILIIFF